MTPIQPGAVRELLADPKLFPGLPADLGDDAELALDSLGLVWLLHQIHERYGLAVEPSDADIDDLTSVRRITAYFNRAALDRAALDRAALDRAALDRAALDRAAPDRVGEQR